MKFRIGILFLFSLFATASPNRVEACSNDDTGHATQFHDKSNQKSCCSDKKQGDVMPCAQNEDVCNRSHPGQSCPPDDDGCGGCHCPGCGTVSHSGATFALETQPLFPLSDLNASLQKQAFYFSDQLPEAVYLPIWLPPKI